MKSLFKSARAFFSRIYDSSIGAMAAALGSTKKIDTKAFLHRNSIAQQPDFTGFNGFCTLVLVDDGNGHLVKRYCPANHIYTDSRGNQYSTNGRGTIFRDNRSPWEMFTKKRRVRLRRDIRNEAARRGLELSA